MNLKEPMQCLQLGLGGVRAQGLYLLNEARKRWLVGMVRPRAMIGFNGAAGKFLQHSVL